MISILLTLYRQRLAFKGTMGLPYRSFEKLIVLFFILLYSFLLCLSVMELSNVTRKADGSFLNGMIYLTTALLFFLISLRLMSTFKKKRIERYRIDLLTKKEIYTEADITDHPYRNFEEFVQRQGWDDKQLEAIHTLLGKEIEKQAAPARLLINIITVLSVPGILISLNRMVMAFNKVPSFQWKACCSILMLCIAVWLLLKSLKVINDEYFTDIKALEDLQDFVNWVRFIKQPALAPALPAT